jgi:hypothetical protein
VVLRCSLNDFKMQPLASIITGITFVFTFHMRWISIVGSQYFRIFSSSFLITFLSPEIPTSSNIHVPFSLSPFMTSSLWLGMVLSICTCWFYHVILSLSRTVSTDFGTWSHCWYMVTLSVHGHTVGTWSHQCSMSNFTPFSLHMFKCIWAQTPSCLFM